jgi:TPR repeat protein
VKAPLLAAVLFGSLMLFAADQPTLEQLDRTLFRAPPLPPKFQGSITSLVALAEQGDPQAQCWVGLHYTFGTGVKQDVTQAVRWLDKSANQGFAPAEYSLGFCYKHGLGVSSNSAAATEWFQKAADQGYAPAKHEAALTADRNGKRAEALKLLREAAGKGFPSSQYLMGCVVSDQVESYMWHSLAAENGLENASARQLELRQQLTKEQLTQADERIRKFKQNANVAH